MPPRRNNNSNAQDDAARMIRNAQDDAARMIRNAQDDAARMIRNAQDDAARMIRNFPEAEERELNEKMPITENAALKKDKMYTIGEMSSRLAHDLQNPLTIIKNTVEILKQSQPNPDKATAESYERVDRAVSRMSQIVRDVLDYVRTSEGLMERTSVVRLLKTVASSLQVPDCIRMVFPTEDTDVYGDVKQLETVFSNLILNSIQAIDGNGKIMIQASDISGETVIEVIDNGSGIEKENIPKIFEPLFTTKPHGTGLGLASCKSIIEAHGGTIDCTSIVGKGTAFTIKLPKS